MRNSDHVDVVVVGGGSCGCVLASRLSENSERSVLLLEAGPTFVGSDEIPTGLLDASTLPIGPGSEWVDTYEAELNEDAVGTVARGRVLGGSGAVNGGYFVRATPADFDAWPGTVWTYDQVLPFYVGSETDLDVGADRRWHGSSGPMPVARTPAKAWHPSTSAFVDSAVNAGFSIVEDLNSPSATTGGVGAVPLNVRNGIRVNAAAAYLWPVMARKGLRVQGATTVLSVVFRGSAVIGVEAVVDGSRSFIRSDTVILSAGAVHTPTLLLRSGIGAADDLEALGISVVADIPGVGKGFSDHPEVVLPVEAPDGGSRASAPLEAVLHAGDIEVRPYTRRFDRMIPGLPVGPHSMGVGLMRSAGRGTISLRTDDPSVAPRVRYHYLESEKDRRAMQAGVELAVELIAPFGGGGVSPSVPDLSLTTSVHLSGSAKMGPDGDPTAVCDEHCRVRGVDGLYVVDTSAFPVVPSRGPHATAIMFAERAADLIARAIDK